MLVSMFSINGTRFTTNKKFIEIILWIGPTFILLLSFLYFMHQINENQISSKNSFINNFLINNGFTLKNIKIFGVKNISRQSLIKIINTYNTSNIFNLDLNEMHKKIESNTWVKESKIERVLPNSIKISIVEKTPIAIWQSNYGNKLITKNGEIISASNINFFKNHLPIIKGSKANEYISSILNIVRKNQDLSQHIWSFTFINERRWDLRFNQGLIIRLPEVGASDAWKMIVKLEKNYKILKLRLTEIDLRNSGQILAKINLKKDLILKRNNL